MTRGAQHAGPAIVTVFQKRNPHVVRCRYLPVPSLWLLRFRLRVRPDLLAGVWCPVYRAVPSGQLCPLRPLHRRLSRGGHPTGWHERGTAGGDGAPLSAAAAGHWLKARRAIRNFRPEAPDKALLRSALDVAAYAPTAHNAREVGYTILHGRPQVEALLRDTVELMEAHGLYAGHTRNVRNGNDTLFRGAPCLILIHAPERILSETDCATAAAYLELILPSLGLGSCWAGMLLEACAHGSPAGLDLPEGHKLYAALMVGTPAVSYRRIPFRSAPVCLWK